MGVVLLTKRIRTEVDRHNRKRQTYLLQTGGVKLRLIDDLYSHLVVKNTKKTACVSLLLRVYAPATPVIATRPDISARAAQLSLLHKYRRTAVWQRGLCRKKKEQHNRASGR